jgi:hypothetical protein
VFWVLGFLVPTVEPCRHDVAPPERDVPEDRGAALDLLIDNTPPDRPVDIEFGGRVGVADLRSRP